MKKYIIKDPTKFLVKKRVLLINALLFTVIMSFLVAGCIKEDYPVRLVFPVLTTAPASAVTATTAASGGDITADGGFTISARGVCCDTIANPHINSPIVTSDGTGTGQFTSSLTNLKAAKTYHIRAYATNPEGTSYGQDISFTTATK
jgi:hypothetical protein